MRSEEQCPPHSRFLYADMRLSPEAITLWQQATQKRMLNKDKNPAYHTYMQWTCGPQEVALFTMYAYADLEVPRTFDCIFHYSHPEVYVCTPYTLTQSIWEGWFPVDFVEDGHKHLCIFSFAEGIPDIIQTLSTEHDYRNAGNGVRLGLCRFNDLQAIINRKTKEARLKALHGNQWHEFDDE